ncbi:MAG TPA: metal/formaldehyde-sensitive transcriptional repressor [Alphaproteobacteria bacterium]|nr:metal/formaldehyde-sensitive transcriptional repressor [Alphaproteobacteria bacterium]
MTHQLDHEQKKLINRVRRIAGQVDAIERAIQEDSDGAQTMQLIAACKGALDGLMAEIIEDHIRHHMIERQQKSGGVDVAAAEELIDVVKAYLK